MRTFQILSVLTAVALSACTIESRYEHVERVVRNDPGAFTVYVRDGGGQLMSAYLATSLDGEARVVADVPAGAPMWATETASGFQRARSIVIHVHALSDVEEAPRGR